MPIWPHAHGVKSPTLQPMVVKFRWSSHCDRRSDAGGCGGLSKRERLALEYSHAFEIAVIHAIGSAKRMLNESGSWQDEQGTQTQARGSGHRAKCAVEEGWETHDTDGNRSEEDEEYEEHDDDDDMFMDTLNIH